MSHKRNVLYVCYFYTATIQAYVHRCKVEAESDAVLVVYSSIKRDNGLDKIFNKVIYADDARVYHFCNDEGIIEQGIYDYYSEILNDNNVGIENIDEIYVSCDMLNDFAIYCGIREKPYQIFESYANQLMDSRVNLYQYHIQHENAHGSPEYFKVAEKYLSICGTNLLCTMKWVQSNSDTEKHAYCKYRKYDFTKDLLELTSEQQAILVDCFDDNEIKIQNYCDRASNALLILTQRQWQFSVTEIETGVLYQYLVDYVLLGKKMNINIAIKPHPSDTWKHEDFFEGVTVFPTTFPADLFPIIDSFKINSALTVSSTAIEKFMYWCDDLYTVGITYFKMWRDINKYYFAMRVLEILQLQMMDMYRSNVPEGDAFFAWMRQWCFCDEFQETKWISLSVPFYGVTIVGDTVFDEYLNKDQYYYTLENLPDSSIIIFLDLQKNMSFIDYEHLGLLRHVIPLEIIKEKSKSKVYASDEIERIYVYTRNEQYKKALRNVLDELQLSNVGFMLKMSCGNIQGIEKQLMYRQITYLKKTVEKHEKVIDVILSKQKTDIYDIAKGEK